MGTQSNARIIRRAAGTLVLVAGLALLLLKVMNYIV